MPRAIQVGAVSYLNARPLYFGLAAYEPRIHLDIDLPSRLAARLRRGDLDVALIPSVEYFRGVASGYEILPGFAIAARGLVRSVKLFSRVPFDQIHRLALDEGSRTSQALTRVWLDAVHGVRPELIESLPMGLSPLESTADAVLVIGDRAMKVPDAPWHSVVDLAEAWQTMTGLPFVFALWVVRPGVDLGDLPTILDDCRREGLAQADVIAREFGPKLDLDVAACFDYLTKILSYDLGETEQAGLRLFGRLASDLGLAPRGADLVFHCHHHPRRLDLATRR